MNDEQIDAFYAAVKSGDLELVARLLDAEPSLLEVADQTGLSPLTTAVYYGRRDVADLLIARGVRLDLFVASALGAVGRIMALLDRDPALIKRHSVDGWAPLALAAHFGQLEAATLLLDRGAEPSARSANALHNTPLHAAVAGNRPQMCAVLLARGADLDARDANGYTALNIAAHAGSLEMVDLLLTRGADARIPNNQGDAPLAVAEAQGHTEIAKCLRHHLSR